MKGIVALPVLLALLLVAGTGCSRSSPSPNTADKLTTAAARLIEQATGISTGPVEHTPTAEGNPLTSANAASTPQPTVAASSPPGQVAPARPPIAIAPVMAGNARPSLSSGPSGELDVIYEGRPYNPGNDPSFGTAVPVVVWNGTNHTVNSIDVSGAATMNGQVVGSGDSQDVEPANLAPGEVAFGVVFFEAAVPSDAAFMLTATAEGGEDQFTSNLQISQANYSATGGLTGSGAIVGSVANSSGVVIGKPIAVDVYCFDGAGRLRYIEEGFVSGDALLTIGATGFYSVDLDAPAAGNCSSYLVGSSGFKHSP